MPAGPPRKEFALGDLTDVTKDDDFVMGLVEEALARPIEDREQFVRNACAGNASLFETVWHYVDWDDRMQGFLLQPVQTLPNDGPADEPALEAGQMLQNRFRILRKVAGGGMGVVYEAWDQKLDRRIAIKCAKAGFHARLSPEVRHASEINHPNVCKTWEIHTASGQNGDFDFLTMEFIDGQTLAEALREGPLPKKQARIIAAQLCAGLAEAHRHQVIHGDLKPNNVLLARGPEGIRAVITDFGLARGWAVQGAGQGPAVMSGAAGGTLNYMAPELLKGGRPSAASDIYALGVILREMACGRLPLIARCLDPEPARRYANVSDVARALVPFPALRWAALAASVVFAAGVGAIGYRTVGVSHETVRLAVLPFTADADSKSLSDGLLQDTADRLRGVKDDSRKLTIIPMRDAVRNKVDTPENAAASLGATHTLSGTLRQDNGGVAVHAVLTDARSQLKLKEWDARYKPAALSSMPVALAGIVTGTLRLKPLASTATVNAAAYPDFTAGLGLLQRDGGVDAALPFLTRAVTADPDSPLTHARLAEAEARKYRLSFDSAWLDKARQSLHDATQRNPDLPLVWLVSGRINEYTGFYEEAESDLQRALQIDPRDGDAWRRLGQIYQENNRFPEAVVAYRKSIDAQPDYFMNYFDLCSLYTYQANYVEAIQQCRKMVRLAPDLSEAHLFLAIPYFESGDYAESESEFLLAIKLDPMSAKALFGRGFALTSRGRWKEALPLFHRAVEIGPATHLLYSALGTTYRLAGLTAEARKAYSAGLDLAEKELENNPRDAILKAQMAYLCAELGQRSRASSEGIQARQFAAASVEVAWWLTLTWDALDEPGQAIAELQHVPDDVLRRIKRETDLADLRQSSRFQNLLKSRNIQ